MQSAVVELPHKICRRLTAEHSLNVLKYQVFINRAQLIKGTPAMVENEVAEYLWVTKHEIGEYLGDSLGVYLRYML